jgi:RHS repeat-associated protein
MTVSDWKEHIDGSMAYEAQVLSYNQYYPFGSRQVGRGTSSLGLNEYRFGFNGKENDTDFGDQIIQDYGFRLYNPAIGKFLSVDPLSPEYPELTPYQFASNSPISGVDLDGLEYLYASDGSFIGKYGDNTNVIIVQEDVAREAAHVIQNPGKYPLYESMFFDGPWGYTAQYSEGNPISHDDFVNIRTATAIALGGSAASERTQAREFFWVYYNRFKESGISGFNASTTYKKKKPNYYMFEYMLGREEYSGPSNIAGKSAQDYYEYAITMNPANKAGSDVWSEIIAKMRNLDANNPYEGFKNKGNIGDLNGDNGSGKMWDMSRMYLHLKENGSIDGSLIERTGSGKGTQYLFNLDGIEQFFKENTQYNYQEAPRINEETGDFAN